MHISDKINAIMYSEKYIICIVYIIVLNCGLQPQLWLQYKGFRDLRNYSCLICICLHFVTISSLQHNRGRNSEPWYIYYYTFNSLKNFLDSFCAAIAVDQDF